MSTATTIPTGRPATSNEELTMARAGGLRALTTVAWWEIRRTWASRRMRAGAAAVVLMFALLTYATHRSPQTIRDPGGAAVITTMLVDGSSGLGSAIFFSGPLSLILGLIVPFLTAEPAVRDWRRRTHELVLTAPVPGWAYVWGRALAALVAALAVDLLILATYLAGNEGIHLFEASYPAPDLVPALAAWVVVTLPSVLLLGGVGFAAALTLRRAAVIEAFLAVGWVGARILGHNWAWPQWDPTSGEMSVPAAVRFGHAYVAARHSGLGPDAAARLVERAWPDLGPFVGPHLLYAAIGVAAVVVVGLVFARHRSAWT